MFFFFYGAVNVIVRCYQLKGSDGEHSNNMFVYSAKERDLNSLYILM